jgi:TRAP-type C4-dicarboxylate transport system permease small subunit
MNVIHRINSWIEKGETALIVFIVIFMVFLAFLQVVLRNVFSQGLLWGDILLRQLVLWIGFIGASLATREEKHINIDLFCKIDHPSLFGCGLPVSGQGGLGICNGRARDGHNII